PVAFAFGAVPAFVAFGARARAFVTALTPRAQVFAFGHRRRFHPFAPLAHTHGTAAFADRFLDPGRRDRLGRRGFALITPLGGRAYPALVSEGGHSGQARRQEPARAERDRRARTHPSGADRGSPCPVALTRPHGDARRHVPGTGS